MIEFLPCTREYWEFVRKLRLDDRVVNGFIRNGSITPDEQVSYMEKNWRAYFIAAVDGKPVGYVGCLDNDIRICTHPDYQRSGIASFLLTELNKIHPTARAVIKVENVASQHLFEANGFEARYVVYERRATI